MSEPTSPQADRQTAPASAPRRGRPPFAIDLNTVPSAMETLAASWSRKDA